MNDGSGVICAPEEECLPNLDAFSVKHTLEAKIVSTGRLESNTAMFPSLILPSVLATDFEVGDQLPERSFDLFDKQGNNMKTQLPSSTLKLGAPSAKPT
ncbi:MAG: hypothetical protein WDM70_11070 [Nitrosomonadales bacterium]